MGGSEIAGLVVFLLMLGIFCYIVFYMLYSIYRRFSLSSLTYMIPLKPEYRRILLNKFPYYRQLNFQNRQKFQYRLKYFLKDKNFYGQENLEITDEMKILVGAAAVQVTFGFQAMQLPSFNKIILYPHAYYSKHSNKKHKGEVNSSGAIVFSWEDFLKGYQVSDDGFNVGLHEMAHALQMEDLIPNEEYSFLDEEALNHWHEIAEVEMVRVRNGQNKFLRSYAATNQEEFFAVSVEQFFEQPGTFKNQLPEVYDALADLLQQDPLELQEGN